jgi:hypothetical protein
MEISCFRNENQDIFLNLNIETRRMTKCGAPNMKVERPTYISSGRNRSCIGIMTKICETNFQLNESVAQIVQ